MEYFLDPFIVTRTLSDTPSFSLAINKRTKKADCYQETTKHNTPILSLFN